MSSPLSRGALAQLGQRPSSDGDSATAGMAGLYKGGKLTAEGRAKLQKIKEREALKDHLVTKYETKYGKKEEKPTTNTVYVPKLSPPKTRPTAEDRTQSAPSVTSDEGKQAAAAAAPVSEWALITQYNMNNTNEYEKKKKHLVEERKKMLKTALDAQKAALWSNPDKLKKEKEDELKRAMDDVHAYEEEERLKHERRHHMVHEENTIRQLQIKDTINRRQKERVDNLRQEERLVERIVAEIAAEKQAVLDKKKAERAAAAVVMQQNTAYEEIKHQQLLKEQAEEVLLQKAYIKLMDKQENDRKQALLDMLAKSEGSQKLYSASVGASLSSQAEDDARRALAMQEEFNRQKTEQDRLKAERKHKEEMDTKETLFRQMDLRRVQKETEDAENRAYALELKALAERAKQEAAEQKRRAEDKKLKTRAEFDEAYALLLKRRDAENFSMSETEKKLNRKTLEAVKTGATELHFDEKDFKKAGIVWKALTFGKPY